MIDRETERDKKKKEKLPDKAIINVQICYVCSNIVMFYDCHHGNSYPAPRKSDIVPAHIAVCSLKSMQGNINYDANIWPRAGFYQGCTCRKLSTVAMYSCFSQSLIYCVYFMIY